MTEKNGAGEDSFFDDVEPKAPRRSKRSPSPLLARYPLVSVLALALCSWLFVGLFPDVQFFFSSVEPIDLGGPGAYHFELARENRLVQVRGDLEKTISATETRTAAARTIGLLRGTNLIVDRPGRGGPPVFEGRLLPVGERTGYASAVKLMKERGATFQEGWIVLRDGERPRKNVLPVVGTGLLVLLAAVNLRALLKSLTG